MPRKWNEEIPYQVLVILTTTGRKNLMQSVIVLCLYDVIQRYGAPKNLSPSESTIAMLRVKARDSSSGYRPRSEWHLAVILNGTQWSEKSPVKWAYCEISHLRSRWQAMSFWKALPWRISSDKRWEIPRMHSEWQASHSDDHEKGKIISPNKVMMIYGEYVIYLFSLLNLRTPQ